MLHEPSLTAVRVFGLMVANTLGRSFYFGAEARSAPSYFAADENIDLSSDMDGFDPDRAAP